MPNVEVVATTQGTSVTVFVIFTKPTRTKFPAIVMVQQDPTTVTFTWQIGTGSPTTWTYTAHGGSIERLVVGVYVATIPTATADGKQITGAVAGTGECTAVARFAINVNAL